MHELMMAGCVGFNFECFEKKSNERAINFLQEHGAIPKEKCCRKCRHQMCTNSRQQSGDATEKEIRRKKEFTGEYTES